MTMAQFGRPARELEEKPWERMRDESEEAYNAFCSYLETPVRGDGNPRRYLIDAAKRAGRSERGLYHLFREFRWEERADAYDEFITLHPQALHHLEERRKLASDLRADAEKFRQRAKRDLMIEDIVLRPEDAIKLYKMAVDLEREANRLEQPVTQEQERKLNLQIRDAVNKLTAGLGELALRGEGGTITATRETVAIDLGAEGRRVPEIPASTGEVRAGGSEPEVVEQTDGVCLPDSEL